jgi:hypothetical protein
VLAEHGDVQLAFCWSRVRCRFYELAAAGPAPIASEALERIAGLYTVESEIRGRTADERRAVRQENSRPIIELLPVSRTPSLGVMMEPEVGYGTAQTICAGVQA